MTVDDRNRAKWVADLSARGRDLDQAQTLQFGGGGGTSGPMEPSVPIKDYIDARDEAIESRLSERLGGLATASGVRNNIWGAAAAIIGIILATLAFAGDRFDGGINASGIVSQMKDEQAMKDKAQDAKLNEMNDKLDVLIQQTSTSHPK